MKMEQTVCSETSAYKIQTPGNYPEEYKIVVFDEEYILFHFNVILKHNRMSSTKINDVLLFILYLEVYIKNSGIKVFKPNKSSPAKMFI
jgi:hypothetical protein